MSWAEFSKNFKTGFAQGMELGEKGFKKAAVRKFNKAQDVLDDYINYDPATDPGGALGKPGAKPTSRDIFGVRDAMQAEFEQAQKDIRTAKAWAGDLDWSEAADKAWTEKLSQGFSKFVNMAAAAVESGDNKLAERALNHAGGLMPTGGAYSFKMNKDGNIEMIGVDEATGKIAEKRIVTPTQLRILAASAGDPAKYLELLMANQDIMVKFRQAAIEQAKADEAARSNKAVEKETERSHRTTEAETSRSNRNTEAETHRSHVANEAVAQTQAVTGGVLDLANAATAGDVGSYYQGLTADRLQAADLQKQVDDALDNDFANFKLNMTDRTAVKAYAAQLHQQAGSPPNIQPFVPAAIKTLKEAQAGNPVALQKLKEANLGLNALPTGE